MQKSDLGYLAPFSRKSHFCKLTKRSALAASCAYFFNNSSNSVTSSDWVGKCGHFQIAAPFQRANRTDETDSTADKSCRTDVQEKFFRTGSRFLLVLEKIMSKKNYVKIMNENYTKILHINFYQNLYEVLHEDLCGNILETYVSFKYSFITYKL